MQEVCWKDSRGKGWFPVPQYPSSLDSVIPRPPLPSLTPSSQRGIRAKKLFHPVWLAVKWLRQGRSKKALDLGCLSGNLFRSNKWDPGVIVKTLILFSHLRWCLGLWMDLKILAKFCSSWMTCSCAFSQVSQEDLWEKRHKEQLDQPEGLKGRQLCQLEDSVLVQKGAFCWWDPVFPKSRRKFIC